jgi:Beta-lactamase
VQRFHKLASLTVGCLLVVGFCVTDVPFAIGQTVRAQQRFTTGSLPPPQFADPDRARKLAEAFPEVERLFTAWVQQRHMPGAVLGILIDGELAWVKTAGVRELESRAPVTPDTVFRIASMTKSFTALSILKLRDEGKLSLDDPVARYVPAAADLPYPTKDSPALTIRHLLTHSEGFPEDNPWGDQQLARSEETMHAWIRAGIPFSNAPGIWPMSIPISALRFSDRWSQKLPASATTNTSAKKFWNRFRCLPLHSRHRKFLAIALLMDTVGKTTPGRANHRSAMVRSARWVDFGLQRAIWPATLAS